MNALHRELDKLHAQVTALQAQRAEHIRRRDRALAIEPHRFDQNRVDAAKHEISRLDQHISSINDARHRT